MTLEQATKRISILDGMYFMLFCLVFTQLLIVYRMRHK